MEHDLIALSVLALELDSTPDALALEHGDVLTHDSLGRRAVPASLARELVEAANQRRYETAEALRRQRVAARERVQEIKRRNPVLPGVALAVPEGMRPADVMVAAGGTPVYEGGNYTPRPSSVDWAFGNAEGGASIGPTRSEVNRQARERAAARKRAKP